MRTIAIVNQKGGSGKTTTAISLSAALAERGQRTLLVDLDPQAHCASGLAIPEDRIDLQIGDAMVWPDRTPMPTDRFLWRLRSNLHVVPSTTKLAGLESPRGGLATREDRDLRLARVLGTMSESYDWCLIDCPPYIGLLTFNALRACDEVLIPVEAGYFALKGAGKQVATIEALSRKFGVEIPYRLVPTMYERASKVGDDVLEAIRREFRDSLAPVVIRADEMVREASSMGSPVTEYAPNAHASKDYASLAAYIMEHRAEPAPAATAVRAHGVGDATATLENDPHASSRINDRGDDVGGDGPQTHEEIRTDTEHTGPNEWRRAGEMLSGVVSVETDAEERRPPRDRPGSTVSRAAELAAKARQLVTRSEELSGKVRADTGIRTNARTYGRDGADARSADTSNAEGIGFGATAVGNGVWFVQPGGAEMEICVAGDHNGWVPHATKLTYNERRGRHEAFIVASPGAMRYRVIVNGEWIADPYNPNSQANPYGGRDSIVIVPGAGRSEQP